MTRLQKDTPVPTEYDEQLVVVQYLEARGFKYTAIPNSTWTPSKAVVGKNFASGLRPGLPDLVVVLPTKGLLWIEMKRIKGGRISPEQQLWIDCLNGLPGNAAHVCYGADDAIAVIASYDIHGGNHSPAPSEGSPEIFYRDEASQVAFETHLKVGTGGV